MNKWQQIWNERQVELKSGLGLAELIRLDGFDGGAGKVAADDWLIHTGRVVELLGIQDGDSVYEVGCGSGAFLLGLGMQRQLSQVGGVDYSEPLIAVARQVFPQGELDCNEASAVSGEKDYDYVISHGVFHYFDEPYAEKVLSAMLKKARKAICILDIPDFALKDESEQIRRDHLTPDEYQKKYQGLNHTYYHKSWFQEIAARSALDAVILAGMMPNYAQQKYRFGCLIQIAH